MRTYPAAVATLIAAPRSSAARVWAAPSAWRAWRSGPSRRRASSGRSGLPSCCRSAASAAHAVTASAGRPVAAHSCPQQSRPLSRLPRSPARMAIWRTSRRCAAASPVAGPQVQDHHVRQHVLFVLHGAGLPGLGKRCRADLIGGSQVPRGDQRAGQDVAGPPDKHAGNAGRDLRGLPGCLYRAAWVIGGHGGKAEDAQGQDLSGPVADFPGYGQRLAGIGGRVGGAAQVTQCHRPPHQTVSQRPGWPPARGRVAQRREVLQRPGRARREQRGKAEPQMHSAPLIAARLVAFGDLTSSAYWLARWPRSNDHQPSAAASRSAIAWSWSIVQASTCRIRASSASSRRAGAASSSTVCSPAAPCSAICSAYPACAAATASASPASSSRTAP